MTSKLSAAQLLVYEALLKIPKGKVTTYAALGKHIGMHPRAVGRLLAWNPEPDRYPCFKVVAADGNLRGFALGLAEKENRLTADGVEVVNGIVPQTHFYYFD